MEEERLMYVAQMLKLMGHPLRIQILAMLEQTPELAAGTFHETLNEPQPTVSQHLNRMRLSGLLKIRKQGGQVLYSLRHGRALEVLHCVKAWEVPQKPSYH